VQIWAEHLLPRLTDLALGSTEVQRHRERAVAGLSGAVVEIGFGSGLNVALYPPGVRTVFAVEPSAVARRLAAPRIEASPASVSFVGLDGQELALPDGSVDMALSTFTLCTIPEPSRALRELHRVLRPGGEFHFLEHGLAPDPGVARWQHRLNGIQQRVAGGCHLDRRIDTLVADAGFSIREVRTQQLRGPRLSRPWGHLYCGVAVTPTASQGSRA
jgi:ubiquinone/menaquinone biosynthesis C-methylase UbiE